jgi:uncharacterized membrane protein YoaK (UPF0700 family)
MKTIDVIILSLCVGVFLIALYETYLQGISFSYPSFMLSIGLLFFYSYRRRLMEEKEQGQGPRRKGR